MYLIEFSKHIDLTHLPKFVDSSAVSNNVISLKSSSFPLNLVLTYIDTRVRRLIDCKKTPRLLNDERSIDISKLELGVLLF